MKRFLLALFVFAFYSVTALENVSAQAASPATITPAPQKLDDEYTRLIKEYLQDSRITTELVDALRAQGLEVQLASSAFKAGTTDIAAGDYIIRADQPCRTLADMYFSVQNYPVANPRPYDDTGWTMQYMRNIALTPVKDRSVLDQPMTLISSDVRVPGRIDGNGEILIVEHSTDNELMSFRFKNARVKMFAAEDDFELQGHKFRAGTFIIPNAKLNALRASIQEFGLSAVRRPGNLRATPCARCKRWQWSRRDVRATPVLALADPGNLFPGLQRHPKLDPSRRRKART